LTDVLYDFILYTLMCVLFYRLLNPVAQLGPFWCPGSRSTTKGLWGKGHQAAGPPDLQKTEI